MHALQVKYLSQLVCSQKISTKYIYTLSYLACFLILFRLSILSKDRLSLIMDHRLEQKNRSSRIRDKGRGRRETDRKLRRSGRASTGERNGRKKLISAGVYRLETFFCAILRREAYVPASLSPSLRQRTHVRVLPISPMSPTSV